MKNRILKAGALALAATMTLAACGDGASAAADDTLLIWTLEDNAVRVEAHQAILDRFTAETGIEVEFVSLAEEEVMQVLAGAVAAGQAPDAIAQAPLPTINRFHVEGLTDTAMVETVLDSLGRETFAEGALEMTQSSDGEPIALPTSAWAGMLFYRADLFAAAGLESPTSFAAIQAAAETLHAPGLAGITAATGASDFTQQTFELIAMANGCQMIDTAGEIAFDSPECVEAFEFYGNLLTSYSVPGAQDVDSTRATYFAGQSAMLMWSSFLLDELGGLRDDVLPTLPEAGDDLGWLAENTGIVTAIEGFNGDVASFGEIASWVPMNGANPQVQQFLEFVLSDGYVDWLAVSPEAMVPVRTGTAEEPEFFADGWAELETGVDRRARLSDMFSDEVIDAIVNAPNNLTRWGISQGEGELYGAMVTQNIVAAQIAEMTSGGISAEAVAARAQAETETLRTELGRG